MKRLLFTVLAVLLLVSAVSASEYVIYTEIVEKSQYLDENGKLTGSSVEIVEEIKRRLDDKTEFKVMQWADAYNALKEEDNVILFSASLTDERQELFKWAGPILKKTWVLFIRKDSGVKIDSLEEAKSLKQIGTIAEDAREQFLLSKGFENTVRGKSYLNNIQKLYNGEVDAIIESPLSFYATCERGGVDQEAFKEAFVVKESNLYIAFSKHFPDEIYLMWRNTLQEMYEDGTFESIYKKWYPDSPLPVFNIVKQ